jgi:hypothetical protein
MNSLNAKINEINQMSDFECIFTDKTAHVRLFSVVM